MTALQDDAAMLANTVINYMLCPDKLLATSQEPGFHDKTLPIGNSEANYNATIEVQIRNSIGETTSLNISVTVSVLVQS